MLLKSGNDDKPSPSWRRHVGQGSLYGTIGLGGLVYDLIYGSDAAAAFFGFWFAACVIQCGYAIVILTRDRRNGR